MVKPGARQFSYQGRDYNLATPFRRVTMQDAIVQNNPGIDAARLRDVDYLRGWCAKIGAKFDKSDGAGKLQVHIFDHTVEHTLLDPTFIYAYPAEVSPLSRANDADPFLTDRFEFFMAGRELANGFSELNDPEDQAARFHAQVAPQGCRRRRGHVLRRRLHPRAGIRHAAHRGPRHRRGSPGDVPHRPGRDPRRAAVPAGPPGKLNVSSDPRQCRSACSIPASAGSRC